MRSGDDGTNQVNDSMGHTGRAYVRVSGQTTEQAACDRATPRCAGMGTRPYIHWKRPKRWSTERAPDMLGFVEFGQATFRAGATEAERPREEAGLFGSLVYRPAVFRRNDVGWIAACAWRATG
jgi:hypothetical protein